MTAPAIELVGLTAGYDGTAVVRDLDLSVGPGEVVALLGPNGAGKTTTLRTIAGLLAPISGRVKLHGASVDGPAHRVARQGVSLVPEDRALFFDLTVEENLRLGAGRGDRRAARQRVVEMLPALEPLLYRRAGSLSGGEQQMLALARALASRPRCLLVDEMSLGLAPLVIDRLFPILRRIADEDGVGVLLVEQHVRMALAIADRAYVLAHGRLTLEGPAAALAHQPDRLRAAYFGQGPGEGRS